jgi:hypothetical protein
MQTTITIPNQIYEASEQLAQRLELSLNDLFAVALSAYVTSHQEDDVTEALNRVYATESSKMDAGLAHLQLVSIGGEEW